MEPCEFNDTSIEARDRYLKARNQEQTASIQLRQTSLRFGASMPSLDALINQHASK
jgi:hypothetical protein